MKLNLRSIAAILRRAYREIEQTVEVRNTMGVRISSASQSKTR